MTYFQERLFQLQDKKYAAFQAKLTPGTEPEKFIGVRVPLVRQLAKELYNNQMCENFLQELPHEYNEENMLHSLILCQIRNYEKCVEEVNKFLPFVDNWAVCDIMSPKIFARHRDKLIENIRKWSSSNHIYTCRFGIEMLMSHFLDDDFRPEYLEIPAAVHSQEYYVNMMIAWFFATALAKQWEFTLPYINEKRLSKWTHNKTIQKSVESYRITPEKKNYLKSLKV